jgi:retron-type reverse transcriptase
LISLDAEKAFDKLWRPGIFYKLIERFNRQDWIVLKQYYDISRACVENNEEKTQLFKVINGVKQGGIISPFLFNIYIDELIVSCLSLNLGSKLCEFNKV